MGSTTGSIIINVKGKEVTVGVNAPTNPKDNELWLDTNDGQNILKYYSSKDKKWHNVNDMSGEFSKIYTELKTNYYTKTESDDSVKTIIGETTITKSDGKEVNMKDAINSVIDTANSHTTQIGNIETKFSDYSTIEDVNSKITKAQQTSEDYTIEAIKNLNIGAANLINGSTIYTEDNKLSITATTDDFSKLFADIYVDLEKDETYTFNFKTDGTYGVNNIYPELIITTGNSSELIKLSMLDTDYTYSQTNINKYAANGYSNNWTCKKIGQQKIGDIVRFKLYNSTTKAYNYILAKITAVIDNNKVTATSLGCLMTEYAIPMLISGYSYNQTGIDKYSAYGYTGAWIVTNVSNVTVGSVARIRVKNSTTGRYNYVIAKITAIDTTNKKVTASSFAYVEASYGGIPYTKGDNIKLKCNCTGGNGKLMYKFVAHSLSSGSWWNLTNPQESNECSFNITGTGAYDFVCVVTDELNMRGDSQYVRIFSGIDDDGSGYQSTSVRTYLDTVEAYFLKDKAYTTLFRPSSLPYTFKCTESGRYYLRVDVNKNGSTHSFWNFKMEKGNKATDWSINPVEEHATLKVSSDKINAVVSSLDSEGSITLTDKMAEVVADTISLNGTVKVNGDMIVDGAITVDKIDSNAITSDKISTDAIKSKNYIEPSDTSTPYSEAGTYLNLSDGAITSPVFVVDNKDEKGYLKNIQITGGSIIQESLIDESSGGSETRVTSKLEINNGLIALIPYFNNKPYALGALYLRCADSASPMGDGRTAEILLGSVQNGINTRIDNIGIDTNYIACRGHVEIGTVGNKRITIDGSDNSSISAYGLGHLEFSMFNDRYGLSTSIKYGVVIDGSSFRPCGTGDQVITDAFNQKCAPLHLGTIDHKWANVWSNTAAATTSDRNEKHDIEDLSNTLVTSFILGIQPKSYKYNDGKSGRTHYGMISQDIEELLDSLGMSSLDFAGFIKSPKMEEYIENVTNENGETVLKPDGTPLTEIKTKKIDGEYSYALRYEEFIAPLIKFVQIQNERIDKLENDVLELKNKNTELENKYNDLLSRVEKLENTEGSN